MVLQDYIDQRFVDIFGIRGIIAPQFQKIWVAIFFDLDELLVFEKLLKDFLN